MTSSDYWDAATAEAYDESSAFMFARDVLDPAVQALADLAGVGAALEVLAGLVSRGGWLVVETRRPEVRDWETWSFPETAVDLPDGHTALVSRTVTSEALPLVSFETTTTIDGEALRSTSTLRFRDRAEIEHDLSRHGFRTADVRDAPDRPGKEMVLLAQRD